MSKITHLMKSQHGVYYLRAVIPISVRRQLNLKQREIRISLKTKNKTLAKSSLIEKAYLMSKSFSDLEPWEIEAEDTKKFRLGLKLITRLGEYDINDPESLDDLSEQISTKELEAYVYAKEKIDKKSDPPPMKWSESK